MNISDTITVDNLKYYILRYIQECLEALVAYSVYSFITDKRYDLQKSIRLSMIIGLVTLTLEEYDKKYKDSVKNSIVVTLGTEMLKM